MDLRLFLVLILHMFSDIFISKTNANRCYIGQAIDPATNVVKWGISFPNSVCECTDIIQGGGVAVIDSRKVRNYFWFDDGIAFLSADPDREHIWRQDCDTEAPTIVSCPADQELETNPGKATAMVVYQTPTATDNSGEVSVVCDQPSGSEFNVGQTHVTCVARDSSGNSATCAFQVKIEDTEAPMIVSCPADRQSETNPGKATAMVVYQTPNATDNSGEVRVVCDQPSGSAFPVIFNQKSKKDH
ncbi:hyalin-like [Amphiura filiformis]|uniref:hyalin-like n=1 Tax=Amphiura filiformis TaxID=82378 RepID=UPI003B22690B